MTKKPDKHFTEKLTEWYRKEKRDLPWRMDRSPYHIWVSEIMLQQTRVEAVKGYYKRFITALPEIKNLAEAEEETLLKLWQGLGYYNRVRNMQKAAQTIMHDYGGKFPEDYNDIRGLSGIGDYTAGAIASICFDERVPAVDGNVLRVMTRVLEDGDDIKKTAVKRRIGNVLKEIYPEKHCGDFTQGLIELGALICVPKGEPGCTVCPVKDYCSAQENGTVSEYPVKSRMKERKVIEKAVFILKAGNKTAVRKREKNVLLAGLYEYPNVDCRLTINEAAEQLEHWKLKPVNIERTSEYRHIFSHVEWKMTGFYFTVEEENDQFRWVTEEEMKKEIPLPTAFSYF